MLNVRGDDDVTSSQPRDRKLLRSSWEEIRWELNELGDGEGKAEVLEQFDQEQGLLVAVLLNMNDTWKYVGCEGYIVLNVSIYFCT